MNGKERIMTYIMIADRIIQLAEELGYGIDVDFTGRKPIAIKPIQGKSVKFSKFEEALEYLQNKQDMLKKIGG
jgi:hypothetical protein